MKRLLILALLLTGCSSSPASTAGAPVQPLTGPGNAAVYERINAETDCAKLQAEFDDADTNHKRAVPGSDQAVWSTSYMVAADARMKAIRCY